jgi:histidine ammonia-lyase
VLVGERGSRGDSDMELGTDWLKIEAVARISRDGTKVALSATARQRIAAERVVVERAATGDAAIYGLTTGLGAAVDTRLPPEDISAFQTRAVRARSVAIGPRLPRETVRAMMVARIAGMAAGGSGISPAVLDGLVALLNAGVHPAVPSIGSIGAADLAPLAHLALPLIGEGEAEYQGSVMPGAEALRRASLSPVTLGPKDGLALINSNAAGVGTGALVLCDAAATLAALDASAALGLEAFRGNLSPLDPRAQKARSAPGQGAATVRMTALLAGSELWQPGIARRVQDPLSFRCIAPVHGAALDALDRATQALEIELNSSGDNPLVIAADGDMISTGNFDVTALALGVEHLGQALAQAASLCGERTIKLLSPRLSDLPRFLTPRGGTRTGFATVQKTIAALEAEIRHLAMPAALGVRTLADGVEDHASLLPQVVAKTGEIVERLRFLVAIELMVAAQALDLRPAPLGPPLRDIYQAVRSAVPKLDEDRAVGPDIERIATLVKAGSVGQDFADPS